MAEWLKDSTLGKKGRGGAGRNDWKALFEDAAIQFAFNETDSDTWLKLTNTDSRDGAGPLRVTNPAWRIATRKIDDGTYDWYVQPKEA